MAYIRHTDFYIPVLTILEDLKNHEVNSLIEETAQYCGLTEDERQIRTRKGSQFKYESNIQWAITDLCQGGFIERTSRGVYKIVFDGLLMLEDNPKSPNRDYLEARSDKFKEFRYRKGRRNKSLESGEENLFSNLSEDDIENDTTPGTPIVKITEKEIRSNALDLIEKYTNLKKAKEALKMNTDIEDETIKMLYENLVKKLLTNDIEEFSGKLSNRPEKGYAIIFDCFESNYPKVYWITDNRELRKLNLTTFIHTIADRDKDSYSNNAIQEPHKTRKEKMPPRRIKVDFEDGTSFDDRFAADVFAKTIEKIGAAKIQKLGIVISGFPLVGDKAPDRYQYKVVDGRYYIPVNSSTETKKRLLEEISRALGVNIRIEVQ